MIEDWIKKLNLPMAGRQGYTKTRKSYYADYYGNCFVTLQEEVSRPGYTTVTSSYAAIVSFNINTDNVEEALKKIREAEKNPCFFEVIHKTENYILIYPYKFGYAFLGNCCGYDKDHLVRSYLEIKEKASDINKGSFKMTLRNWVNEYPRKYDPNDNAKNTKSSTLFFIKEWDYLLLDDDKEIRDLYYEFRERELDYHCSWMSFTR